MQFAAKSDDLHFFFGDVDNESSLECCQFILTAKTKNPTICINSIGGDVDGCASVINAMQMSEKHIKTIGMGSVCSSALLIFMAGNQRILFENAAVLSHSASLEYSGKPHEVVGVNKHVKRIEEWMIKHVVLHSNLSKAQVKKYLLGTGENWLATRDCLKWGICDVLVETQVPDDKRSMICKCDLKEKPTVARWPVPPTPVATTSGPLPGPTPIVI